MHLAKGLDLIVRMNPKVIAVTDFEWQAQAIVNHLATAGIKTQLVYKAREYVSVLLGSGSRNFQVHLVNENDRERAEQELKRMELAAVPDEESSAPVSPLGVLKKLTVFSAIGVVMLPVVFNLAATFQLVKLWRANATGVQKFLGLTICILGWLMAGALLWTLLPRLTGGEV